MGTIGARVRKLRKAKGLTQPQLASQVGIDQSTLSDIERGASIRAEVLLRLAAALEQTPEFIVTGEVPQTWPFTSVEPSRFFSLTERQKGIVEGKLMAAIEACETPPEPPTDQAAEDRRHFEAGQPQVHRPKKKRGNRP
jgi:transcriptional regulator with XRE-family HTH domain